MTSRTVTIKSEATVEVSVRLLAEIFCGLDDEAQAQFFIEAAAVSAEWRTTGGLGADWQWYTVGRHLKTCSCSTEEARDMVREIARAATAAEEPTS